MTSKPVADEILHTIIDAITTVTGEVAGGDDYKRIRRRMHQRLDGVRPVQLPEGFTSTLSPEFNEFVGRDLNGILAELQKVRGELRTTHKNLTVMTESRDTARREREDLSEYLRVRTNERDIALVAHNNSKREMAELVAKVTYLMGQAATNPVGGARIRRIISDLLSRDLPTLKVDASVPTPPEPLDAERVDGQRFRWLLENLNGLCVREMLAMACFIGPNNPDAASRELVTRIDMRRVTP